MSTKDFKKSTRTSARRDVAMSSEEVEIVLHKFSKAEKDSFAELPSEVKVVNMPSRLVKSAN